MTGVLTCALPISVVVLFISMEKKLLNEVSRFQKLAGIKEMVLGTEPDQLEEDSDYEEETSTIPSGDTDAMSIAEDDFSATMHAVEDDPVV